MKEVRVVLEEKEYQQLKKIKGKYTWKQYLCREMKQKQEEQQ